MKRTNPKKKTKTERPSQTLKRQSVQTSHARVVLALKREINILKTEISVLKRQLSNLRHGWNAITTNDKLPVADDLELHEDNTTLLAELILQSERPKKGRRYSKHFINFSFVLRTMAPRAYRFLSANLAFPTEKTLKRRTRLERTEKREQICDLECIPQLIRRHLATSNCTVFTLIVDAFFHSVFNTAERSSEKAAFLYLLTPIITDEKPIVLHIHSHHNGKADDLQDP